MKVLKGILKDSLVYYERLERDLVQRLKKLPKGSIKRRQIKGRAYYYLPIYLWSHRKKAVQGA